MLVLVETIFARLCGYTRSCDNSLLTKRFGPISYNMDKCVMNIFSKGVTVVLYKNILKKHFKKCNNIRLSI